MPDPIDMHVGAAIRAKRRERGVSQQVLVGHLGLSYQQLQKYETGVNRVSASMLFKISQSLECKPGDFFPDVAA